MFGLYRDLPDDTFAAIEAALSKYKVIFFRNQAHLDDPEQERLRPGSAILSPIPPIPRVQAPPLFWNSIRPTVSVVPIAGTPMLPS